MSPQPPPRRYQNPKPQRRNHQLHRRNRAPNAIKVIGQDLPRRPHTSHRLHNSKRRPEQKRENRLREQDPGVQSIPRGEKQARGKKTGVERERDERGNENPLHVTARRVRGASIWFVGVL